jgi:ABC-2 type transport system ATP-binding protein
MRSLRVTLSSDNVITVEKLTKRFGDFTAVDSISFTVGRGEIFGFLGSNGSGKSTTIRMLCGILSPTSGGGKVAGFDFVKQPEDVKRSIGYMSQKFSLYENLTPFENIRFYLGVYDVPEKLWKERTDWVLETARITDVKNRLTKELPQGWKQRLALGCAMLHQPGIIFLDEPTSGVDPVTRRHFWEFIGHLSSRGITVFVTTHYMDEAVHCERIAMINLGVIVAEGSPEKIVKEACPDQEKATLNDAFIKLMSERAS